MQVAAVIGLSDETEDLYQVFRNGILLGTVNASDKDSAKKKCIDKYEHQIDWAQLRTIKVMRS